MDTNLEEENLFYRQMLMKKTAGETGRNYLKSRGIELETVKKWEIGWSPYGVLPSNYKGKENEKYKPWEKMWGRITFPIRDQNGKIVSISGRLVLKIKDKPKYDHYSFPSRRILFGLFQNREDIRELNRLIITEGQIDVISAWQHGVKNVSSSFGAHCSLDHFAIASRYANIIDILYDEDAAGKKGTDAIQKFPTYGDLIINLKSNIFPKGEDLDSWIQKHSPEQLNQLLNKQETDTLKRRLFFVNNMG